MMENSKVNILKLTEISATIGRTELKITNGHKKLTYGHKMESLVQNEMMNDLKIENWVQNKLTDGHRSWKNSIWYRNWIQNKLWMVTKVGTTDLGTEIASNPRKEETKQHHPTEDRRTAPLPNGGDGRKQAAPY